MVITSQLDIRYRNKYFITIIFTHTKTFHLCIGIQTKNSISKRILAESVSIAIEYAKDLN